MGVDVDIRLPLVSKMLKNKYQHLDYSSIGNESKAVACGSSSQKIMVESLNYFGHGN